MLEMLAPAIRIGLLWFFTRYATLGYLTPQDAADFTKVAMDVIMYGAPIVYGAWAVWSSSLRQRIARLVRSRRVKLVEVGDPDLAASIPSDKVVS